ncbi:MAG: hypothetical protein NXI04_18845 [Planctomycetaceae bacterium]|nr:hypothetical protein [Planctomycetaceae bacterium]
MFVYLSDEELLEAPQSVRDFIAKKLGVANAPEPSIDVATRKTEAPVESATSEKDAVDRVIDKKALRQTIKERATALAESKGMEVLGPIVKSLGIPKITECPDEKLDDLLAALAVA